MQFVSALLVCRSDDIFNFEMRHPRLFLLFGCLLLPACAATEFTPYQGAQQDWRMAPGTFVDSKYSLPVYYGPPPRPYKILGYLSTGNTRTKGQNLAAATSAARKAGGDAIIVMETGSDVAGVYSTANAVATARPGYATATGYGIAIPIRDVTSSVVVIQFIAR
jgi:hypothetical protein